MKTKEFHLVTQDGLKLTGMRYYPQHDPSGIVCIVHGLGDHFERYEHVSSFLVEQGFAVFGVDLRGHGKSEGKRGHSPDFNFLLNDIEELLKKARREFISSPIFLYGHSLGGNLVLNYVLKRKSAELTGAIVTSPWLRLSFDPPAFQVSLARIMNRIWPAYSDNNQLDAQDLSHDPVVVQKYQDDPLVHSRITAGLFFQVHQAGLWALENASNLTLPVLLMHGSADRLTSPAASEEFAQNSGEKTQLRIWEDFKHETHNELGKERVLQSIGDWLQKRISR